MSAWKLQQSLSGNGLMNYCLNVTEAVPVAGRLKLTKMRKIMVISQKYRNGLKNKEVLSINF